jgi:hypothetical protein
MWNTDGAPIVNAIRELRPGDWDASVGEVSDGVLVMRPARRTRRCCDDELYCVVEVEHGYVDLGFVAVQTLRALVLEWAEATQRLGKPPGGGVHRALLRLPGSGCRGVSPSGRPAMKAGPTVVVDGASS